MKNETAQQVQKLTEEYDMAALRVDELLMEIHSSEGHMGTPEQSRELELLVKKTEMLLQTIETLNEQIEEEQQIDPHTLLEGRERLEFNRAVLDELKEVRARGASQDLEIER
ncbi:MAG: hypothetical protein F9K23_08555 [Bacteroidetes bacterium]|nr:MAG: hypothetical protein F9K23_08555 [Bacteroidota bacterium]